MSKNYKLVIGSPLDYNELVVYIDIDEKNIGLLHKEDGIENIKFEFFKRNENININFDTLLEALIEAKEELLK